VGRLEVVGTGRRRRWSEEEKLSIVAEVRGWDRRPRAAMAFRRRCWLLGAALIVTGHLRGGGPACNFAAPHRPVCPTEAIELTSIAFRKGLARSNEGCVPNVLPPKDRSRRASILSSMRARSKIWAWFPADSFEVETDRWITIAEHRRRNGSSAKLRYQPI